MSIITANNFGGKSYQNSYFSLKVTSDTKKAKILMDMLIPIFDTKILPQTSSILKKELPSIMYSKCFNENDWSFAKEVKNTEIGHLFEHILLEYISEFKRLMGIKNPIHNGMTSWNWQKEPQGRFHILIDIPRKDKDVIDSAIRKSLVLLSTIIESSQSIGEYSQTLLPDIIKPNL